jgi:hypothetical protein
MDDPISNKTKEQPKSFFWKEKAGLAQLETFGWKAEATTTATKSKTT